MFSSAFIGVYRRPIRGTYLMLRYLFLLAAVPLHAESGADAWLRHAPLDEASARQYRAALPAAVVTFTNVPGSPIRAERIAPRRSRHARPHPARRIGPAQGARHPPRHARRPAATSPHRRPPLGWLLAHHRNRRRRHLHGDHRRQRSRRALRRLRLPAKDRARRTRRASSTRSSRPTPPSAGSTSGTTSMAPSSAATAGARSSGTTCRPARI